MVRSVQFLHPPFEPAPLRLAATLVLLRDGAHGLEVLMTRRSASARFAANAYVFPGGRVEAADEAAATLAACRAGQDGAQRMQAVAALRETFEELGLLLARDGAGRPVDAATVAAMDRGASLAEQCRARGLTLACDALFPFARWVAARDIPIRFDTPFFVARMPDGQLPVADETEQFEPEWVRPADALARHAQKAFQMIFPTVRTLERLAAYDQAAAVIAACQSEQPLFTSCPRCGQKSGHEARFMEPDSPFGELALVCPDGQPLHALDWQSEHAVPLLKNLQRLTAPNRGAMTGPGTNSYLVGDAASGFIAIDPGPADTAHLQRLHDAAGGDIRLIVCTHSHPDHAPGAAPLQALCKGRPPILGLPSAPTARAHSHFTPDRALQDGERIAVGEAPARDTLRVVFTPGHAANHLCLLLEEDGILFSGDHVLNGSTTVVDPPDGDMDQYLASLDRLDALCAAEGVQFIAPAHGHVIGDARAAIARLKAHRLAREAKIAAAMRQRPDGTEADWLPLAYDDVPERMWPVAARSLAAHVARIRRMGMGRTDE